MHTSLESEQRWNRRKTFSKIVQIDAGIQRQQSKQIPNMQHWDLFDANELNLVEYVTQMCAIAQNCNLQTGYEHQRVYIDRTLGFSKFFEWPNALSLYYFNWSFR